MFELSLVELLFIAVVGLIVIGPQDLPKALAAVFRVFKQVREVVGDIRREMDAAMDESGVRDMEREAKTIIDQDGNPQRTYDISEFLQDENKPRVISEKDLHDKP